jgi:hypothetical protein
MEKRNTKASAFDKRKYNGINQLLQEDRFSWCASV